MGRVYQNEQKCMFIFWSWRAIPWSVTNAEMHSSFPLWDSLGRKSFVWCCVPAGKLLVGWQVTPQCVIPSSAISQPSMASYYQQAWFSQLGLTPAHRLPRQSPAALYQSLSKERWSAAPVLQPAQRWSTFTSSAKDHTIANEAQRWWEACQ